MTDKEKETLRRDIRNSVMPYLRPVSQKYDDLLSDRFLDLQIIYGMTSDVEDEYSGFKAMAFISRKTLELLDVDEEEIREQARRNLYARSDGMPLPTLIGLDDESDEPQCFVISVSGLENGAAAVLDRFLMIVVSSELHSSDLLVFPSSKHEMICVPYDPEGISVEECKVMHSLIQNNEDCLEEGDRLSNHVYLYRHDTETIEILGGDPDDPNHIYQYE